jgi:uncharacterized membrane protein
MSILVRLFQVLLAVAFVVLAYLITLWVLGLLGLTIPFDILKVVFVILGLLAVLGALQGRLDNWKA